ncbi:hypothetical protein ABFS82_11G127400 [Erythranthe guttata]|uniref:Uncharacterized protein n=1 Tax=Erythranthe guttata TaxID=4155 RepID=A0A022R3A2_ERYGU|nr:PREDICTED: uncharacterized protein LOC105960983 [Erythranthe guttata]EYU34701.1 hypothetical protein MIMGU_mgv1a014364mg [Erythranthe guttata]|eukprot:XP_012840659.1 PREDICTED: uncharacterized protein LOC105960983 [Erythranthe guttata]
MASSSLCSVSRPNYHPLPSSHSSFSSTLPQFHFSGIKCHTLFKNSAVSCSSSVMKFSKHSLLRSLKVKAVAEEESTLVSEEDTLPPPAAAAAVPDPTVSVPVSPSDVLTMFFQAEGTMTDLAIPGVTKALQEVEGITDLKVQVIEGIATVELTKQTTVQATGVASNLVETIQGSGFKLQTLNLSFQDEEDFS